MQPKADHNHNLLHAQKNNLHPYNQPTSHTIMIFPVAASSSSFTAKRSAGAPLHRSGPSNHRRGRFEYVGSTNIDDIDRAFQRIILQSLGVAGEPQEVSRPSARRRIDPQAASALVLVKDEDDLLSMVANDDADDDDGYESQPCSLQASPTSKAAAAAFQLALSVEEENKREARRPPVARRVSNNPLDVLLDAATAVEIAGLATPRSSANEDAETTAPSVEGPEVPSLFESPPRTRTRRNAYLAKRPFVFDGFTDGGTVMFPLSTSSLTPGSYEEPAQDGAADHEMVSVTTEWTYSTPTRPSKKIRLDK